MMTLSASASPYWATTCSDTGVRHGEDDDVPGRDGAESPGRGAAAEGLARSAALAGSRPMTSTALPPATASAPMARAMFPVPMMLMLLMMCPALSLGKKVDSSTI